MNKAQNLFNSLNKALEKMEEALKFENSEPFRESTIQRFEYTFEISWKLMAEILRDEGIDIVGMKSTIREAARLDLITDVNLWLKFADARNLTSHIYKEEIALEVYDIATHGFVEAVKDFVDIAKNKLG